MTDDELRRATHAQEIITAYLTRKLASANEKAVEAVGSARAEDQAIAARQARNRLKLWQTERRLDTETAQAIAHAVLSEMEDAKKLVSYAEGSDDADPYFKARQDAANTRQWLRDQGYDIPDYLREPGL